MRDDQRERLQELEEELLDLFLTEIDPKGFPGAGLKPSDMDSKTRGDRVWCKKDAAHTLAVILRMQRLVEVVPDGSVVPPAQPPVDEDDGLEAGMKSAEKEAEAMIRKIQSRQT